MSGSKVYVGGLRPDINAAEVEDEFARFGKIYKIWVARNPPGFAFIDFEDFRDAEDAVRKLDGYKGWRVEISRSRGPAPRGSGGPPVGRPPREAGCFVCGEMGHMARDCRGAPPPRGNFSPRRSRSPPRRHSFSPRRRSPSPPPRRAYSPRRRSPSPLPRAYSPRRRSPSPPPRAYSPRRRSPSPPPFRARSRSPLPRRSRSRSG